MNKTQEAQVLADLFRLAIDSQSIPEMGHLIEDDELLTCWSMGLLSDDEIQKCVGHLANCPRCRHEVAAMIDTGVLDFQHISEECGELVCENDLAVEIEPAAEVPAASLNRHRAVPIEKPVRRFPWVLTVAAGIATVMAAVWWCQNNRGPSQRLAEAQRALHSGDARTALAVTENLITGKIPLKIRRRAEDLLMDAALRLAKTSLAARDFDAVVQLEERVSRLTRISPRLEALVLQAQQRVPDDVTLIQVAALTDYGYFFDGRMVDKGLPVITEATEEQQSRFAKAIEQFPQDVLLRLNYGQFLLAQNEWTLAQKQFQAALKHDANNVLARIGLGLAEYGLDRPREALKQFSEACRLDPYNAAAHINAAICLERLQRPSEASHHWTEALKWCARPDLKQNIEQWISAQTAPPPNTVN